MTPSTRKALLLVVLFSAGGMLSASMFNPEPVSGAYSGVSDAYSMANRISGEDDLKPVDDMHHYMEYIFEPVFDGLKESMEKEPQDKKVWAKIKSSAMILAESSIQLKKRVPEKAESETWEKSSDLVYAEGSKLYRAARQKDYTTAKKHFTAMMNGCKQCHEAYRK